SKSGYCRIMNPNSAPTHLACTPVSALVESWLEMNRASGETWAMSQRRFLTKTTLVTRRAALMGLLLCLFPLFLLAETAPFRFAWLSDTHVGSGTGEQDLRAAVIDINS